MLRNKVDNVLSDVIATLRRTNEEYDTMKGDGGLPPAFHGVGQRIGLVLQTLQPVQGHLKAGNLAGDPDRAILSLEDCSKKAKLLDGIFKEVAPPPETSRLTRYHAAVRQQGKENAVEVLMMGIFSDACVLAEDGAVKAAIGVQIKGLRDAMAELSAMEPSVPEDLSGSNFYHTGSGAQINNTSTGTQYNNTGGGNQYRAEVMHFG